MKIIPWQSYSGENFDRVAHLAIQIADFRRETGRPMPAHGYSHEDWEEAETIVYNRKREV